MEGSKTLVSIRRLASRCWKAGESCDGDQEDSALESVESILECREGNLFLPGIL